MRVIEAVPDNGLSVVSTFSGVGGSSLGYRMAGFNVVWANEFVSIAAQTYRLNHPGVHVDERNIRNVTADELLEAVGMKRGELDLLDGSPPCTAFSRAGKVSEGWGKRTDHGNGKYDRADDLFFEYVRILDGLQPKVFLAENVKGLVIGKSKGYFLIILAALKACGYNVKAKILDAQWLGVPQRRPRVIFIGTRNDLNLAPAFPKPFPYRYTFRDAVRDLPDEGDLKRLTERMARWWKATPPGQSLSKGSLKVEGHLSCMSHAKVAWDLPCPCMTAHGGYGGLYHPSIPRPLTLREAMRVASFPDAFQWLGTLTDQRRCLGNSVPPLMMKAVAEVIRDDLLRKPNTAESRCVNP